LWLALMNVSPNIPINPLTATLSVRIEISRPVNHIDSTLNDFLIVRSTLFLFSVSQSVEYWERELFNLKNWGNQPFKRIN